VTEHTPLWQRRATAERRIRLFDHRRRVDRRVAEQLTG
jgi:hypothetical protein